MIICGCGERVRGFGYLNRDLLFSPLEPGMQNVCWSDGKMSREEIESETNTVIGSQANMCTRTDKQTKWTNKQTNRQNGQTE